MKNLFPTLITIALAVAAGIVIDRSILQETVTDQTSDAVAKERAVGAAAHVFAEVGAVQVIPGAVHAHANGGALAELRIPGGAVVACCHAASELGRDLRLSGSELPLNAWRHSSRARAS